MSAPMPRSGACHTCRWLSTRPGSTTRPVASRTSASPAARSGPTAVITPSTTSTSALGSAGSAPPGTRWPPLTSRVSAISLLTKLLQKLYKKLLMRNTAGTMGAVERDAVDAIAEAWERELPGVIGVGLALGKRATRVSAMLATRAEAELGRFGLTKAEYEILA